MSYPSQAINLLHEMVVQECMMRDHPKFSFVFSQFWYTIICIKMSTRAGAVLILNLGCEMIYILDQRLQAQVLLCVLFVLLTPSIDLIHHVVLSGYTRGQRQKRFG